MPAVIDKSLCIGCGACLSVCPAETISFNEDSKAQVEPEHCISCSACVNTCPMSAIKIEEAE